MTQTTDANPKRKTNEMTTMYNLEGHSVAVEIVRANGETVREEMIVESHNETAAINLAIESVVAAYPGAKKIGWIDHMPLDGRPHNIDGNGVVYGVWFKA